MLILSVLFLPYPAPAPISRAAIALSFSSRAFRALSDSAVSCAVGGAANSLARRSMMASSGRWRDCRRRSPWRNARPEAGRAAADRAGALPLAGGPWPPRARSAAGAAIAIATAARNRGRQVARDVLERAPSSRQSRMAMSRRARSRKARWRRAGVAAWGSGSVWRMRSNENARRPIRPRAQLLTIRFFIPLEPAAVKREKREKHENSSRRHHWPRRGCSGGRFPAAAASRSPARDALDFARGRINSHSIASRPRPARTGALKIAQLGLQPRRALTMR